MVENKFNQNSRPQAKKYIIWTNVSLAHFCYNEINSQQHHNQILVFAGLGPCPKDVIPEISFMHFTQKFFFI